ncbi:MAG: phosphatidate cytidylyltransferase [Zetaproteobacteria bacterium]|nr:MAG: phosphatidate cytidylyltransferase [Zetaproteobacteria bacterium]
MTPELVKRILTASILAPLTVWWILYTPSPWFDWLLGILAVAALFELVCMLSLPLRFWFALAASAAVALILASEHAVVAILLLGVAWTALLMISGRTSTDEALSGVMNKLASAYWLAIWVLIFVWVLLLLHQLPFGKQFALGAFVGVWASDIGAYFAGKRFGRNKLCPAISPGKTVEGALAGTFLGALAAAAIWVLYAHVSINLAVVLGVALTLSGILGDLAESAVKRAAHVKDSGNLLPGHGGLLDRIDALVPAVSVAGLLWIGL